MPIENEGYRPDLENPKIPDMQGATDMEIVLFFMQHIDKPCEVEVSPSQVENIRSFYIREAKKSS